jgi:hypothetical protein
VSPETRLEDHEIHQYRRKIRELNNTAYLVTYFRHEQMVIHLTSKIAAENLHTSVVGYSSLAFVTLSIISAKQGKHD